MGKVIDSNGDPLAVTSEMQEELAEACMKAIEANILQLKPLMGPWKRLGYKKRVAILMVWKALLMKEIVNCYPLE